MCQSKKVDKLYGIESSDTEDDNPEIFLGEVTRVKNRGRLKSLLIINQSNLNYTVDSGADVSVIPWGIYNAIPKKTQLKKTNKKLYGPCHYQLVCRGKFIATLHYDEKSYEEEIYVIEDLERPLLGRQACKALGIFQKVAEIRSASDKQQYVRKNPRLFKGLRCLEGEYEIKIDPAVQPFNLTTPRRIPIPQLPKVKKEIHRMEELGGIQQFDEPTQWSQKAMGK